MQVFTVMSNGLGEARTLSTLSMARQASEGTCVPACPSAAFYRQSQGYCWLQGMCVSHTSWAAGDQRSSNDAASAEAMGLHSARCSIRNLQCHCGLM